MQLRRKLLKRIVALLLLTGISVAVFLYVNSSNVTDEQFTWNIYRLWEDQHREFISAHGIPNEFKFVDVAFQDFSTGYIVFYLSEQETFLFYEKNNTFRKITTRGPRLTNGIPPEVNEPVLEELLDKIPPDERNAYRALAYERPVQRHVGIVAGIGTAYFEEHLLNDFGPPVADEQRYQTVLYAKGREYELLVGLPIGGRDQFKPGNRESARRITVLYHDNSFEDYQVAPKNNENSFALPMGITQFYRKYSQSMWFWPISILGSLLMTYVLGMSALLLLAWRRGSIIFSRTLLISIAAKPLLVAPGLGRHLLFLGFKQRLRELDVVGQVSQEYFGIPAEDSSGLIPWDATGEALHERIAQAVGPQQAVLLVGRGGAGKSTIIGRLTYLGIEGQLPSPLEGFIPLLIPASYYSGSLTRAIAEVLRVRHGVAVDEEIVKGQMQSGKFLILFDGASEVITPIQQSLEEILRTAHHADYCNCRFIISTRPLDSTPKGSSIKLHSLTVDIIAKLLDDSKFHAARKNQIFRQLQYFGQKPIEPLLFSMLLNEYEDPRVSVTRSQIYTHYFTQLLRVREDENLWLGWQKALETLALRTLIETGRLGVGLLHEHLMNLLGEQRAGDQTVESLSSQLRRLYHLPVNDELDLLNQLRASGLLQRGRRWQFAHDTFEEFFAASYIVSYFDLTEKCPSLDRWKESEELVQAFTGVLEFVREMMDESSKKLLLKMDLPQRWRDCITESQIEELLH